MDRFREFVSAALQQANTVAPGVSLTLPTFQPPTFQIPNFNAPTFAIPNISTPFMMPGFGSVVGREMAIPTTPRGMGMTSPSLVPPLSVSASAPRRGVSGSASAVAAPGSLPSAPTGPAPVGTRDTVLRWLPQVSQVAKKYDVPPAMVLAIMHNESGGDPKAQSGYNPGQGYARGLLQVMPFHFQQGEDPFDVATNLDKGVKFMSAMYHKYGKDPDKTMAAYFGGPGAIDANGNIRTDRRDINISVGDYITKKFQPTFAAYQSALGGGTSAPPAAVPVKMGKATMTGGLTPDQFNSGLSAADAMSACGPAAAVAFARQMGRNPTIQEAVNLAKGVGWTQGGGMAGPQSQVNLLRQMGVQASMTQGVDWNKVAGETQAGRPVIIDTPQHYWVAEGYDPATRRFNFGNSAKVLKATGGRTWLTAQEMSAINQPRSSIYMAGA